jgi:hypothetical protein
MCKGWKKGGLENEPEKKRKGIFNGRICAIADFDISGMWKSSPSAVKQWGDTVHRDPHSACDPDVLERDDRPL